MGKKLTNAGKWKNERWFRLLPAYYKLALDYIEGVCDVDGTWQINVMDLIDDLKIPAPFDFDDFVVSVNTDYDKFSGQPFVCERIRRINKESLWLTYYCNLQMESSDNKTLNPRGHFVWNAFKKLAGKGILGEGLIRGWLPLGIPINTLLTSFYTPCTGVLYIDIDVDRDRIILKGIENSDFWPKPGKKTPKEETPGKKTTPVPEPEGEFTGKPPDAPSAEMTLEDFTAFENKLVADKIFIEPLMSVKKIMTEADLRLWLKTFHVHIAGNEKTRKNFIQYKNHFKNWIINQTTSDGPPAPVNNGTYRKVTNGVTVPAVSQADKDKYQRKHG